MKRSTDRILTTHVGSLPQLRVLDPAAPDHGARLKEDVAAVVAKQRATGLDVINEGEYTKGGDWLSYAENRFGGYEQRPPPVTPLLMQGKDRAEFADFYRHATERGTLFFMPGNQIRTVRPTWVCTGRVTYRAEAEVKREIDLLTSFAPAENAFLTTTAPASLEVYRRNEFYQSEEEYL
ncbi:MAG: hypothetical protein ACREE3_11650, partial [Stellaceae bacterium]